jgi:hypothetical protein
MIQQTHKFLMKVDLKRFSVLFFICVVFSKVLTVYADSSYPQTHKIPQFWDKENDYCYFIQETNVSCVPACIQMILKSYIIDPLPSQNELAFEMKTDINHTTQWNFTYIPFITRGFIEFLNRSLSDSKDLALHSLKENIAKNYRIMVITWYSETDKEIGNITHGRIITGYNETGLFFHDPLSGLNKYFHNSYFLDLWDTNYDYWALIIEQDVPLEPHYLLIKWVNNNLDIVALLIVGLVVEVHYVSRISNFTNSIALYLFFSRKGFESTLIGIYVGLGLIMGIIGLISYILKESLPREYYIINLILYNSFTVGFIMLLSNTSL